MRMALGARVLFLVISVLIASGCAPRHRNSADKILVVASIAPMADFAKKVGGDRVEVKLMVPPGASPHTYQIRPDQMEDLSKASVLVLNGIGLEFWADKTIEAAGNPRLVVVVTAEGLPVLDSYDDHGHGHGANPHVWLNPILAIRQVESIRDALVKADPDHENLYKQNTADFIQQLRDLDLEISATVNRFSSKRFVAFHPAWEYFAEQYGLVQAAVIEEWPGKEPPPSKIKEVIDTMKKINAKAIFAEPQFSAKSAQVVAEEAGATVLYLDPLGSPPDYDYLATMRDNLAQMERALK